MRQSRADSTQRQDKGQSMPMMLYIQFDSLCKWSLRPRPELCTHVHVLDCCQTHHSTSTADRGARTCMCLYEIQCSRLSWKKRGSPNLEVKWAIHAILLRSEDGRQVLSHAENLLRASFSSCRRVHPPVNAQCCSCSVGMSTRAWHRDRAQELQVVNLRDRVQRTRQRVVAIGSFSNVANPTVKHASVRYSRVHAQVLFFARAHLEPPSTFSLTGRSNCAAALICHRPDKPCRSPLILLPDLAGQSFAWPGEDSNAPLFSVAAFRYQPKSQPQALCGCQQRIAAMAGALETVYSVSMPYLPIFCTISNEPYFCLRASAVRRLCAAKRQ